MKTAVWAAAFFIGVNMLAAFAGEGEVLPPPVANLPWEHEETGLRLPGELAKMMAEQVFGEDVPEFAFFPREGAGEAGDGFDLEGTRENRLDRTYGTDEGKLLRERWVWRGVEGSGRSLSSRTLRRSLST